MLDSRGQALYKCAAWLIARWETAMSMETAPSMGCKRRRSWGRLGGGVIAVGLALAVAAPSWAASGTATLAPIGTGSYLLTVTNTSSAPVTGFVFTAGEKRRLCCFRG
jgi:hypothetical protein